MQISKRWFQIAFEIRRSQFDFRPGRKFALMKIHTRRASASIFHVSCSLLYHRFSTRFFYEYLTPMPVWSFATCFVAWWRGKKKKKIFYWEPLAQRITINRYPFADNQRRSHATLNCAYFAERIPFITPTWREKKSLWRTRSWPWFKSIPIQFTKNCNTKMNFIFFRNDKTINNSSIEKDEILWLLVFANFDELSKTNVNYRSVMGCV